MRTKIFIAVIVGLIAAGATVAVAGGSDNPGQGTTLHYYAKTTLLPSGQPAPGEWLTVAWDLHELGGTEAAPEPAGDPIGRMAGACTPITQTEGHCVGAIEVDGRGTLTVSIRVVFGGAESPVVVTGGTGEFAGAEGVAHEPQVGIINDRVLTIELTGFNQS